MTRAWACTAILLLLGGVGPACIDVAAIQANDGGAFHCVAGQPNVCPAGYVCDLGTSSCQRWSSDAAAADARTDTGGGSEASVEVPPSEVGPDSGSDGVEPMCSQHPVPGCTPQAGKCDPLCQTGCDGCFQKCSVNTMGALTCNAPTGTGAGLEGASCEMVSSGNAQQTDNCAPGLVCVDRACKTECAKLCRVDADCPGSTCTRDYAPGFKVCDVPAAGCNPVKALGPTNCPGAAQGCYLSPTDTDSTVCDCPFSAMGEGKACLQSRDCLPGLACIDAAGTADYRCRTACILNSAVSGCPNNQTCRSLNGSTKYGYCN